MGDYNYCCRLARDRDFLKKFSLSATIAQDLGYRVCIVAPPKLDSQDLSHI